MNKKAFLIGGAAVAAIGAMMLMSKKSKPAAAVTANSASGKGGGYDMGGKDFGVPDPTTWDIAPTAPGTSNGASVGSMTDPIGADFGNPASLLGMAGASP